MYIFYSDICVIELINNFTPEYCTVDTISKDNAYTFQTGPFSRNNQKLMFGSIRHVTINK